MRYHEDQIDRSSASATGSINNMSRRGEITRLLDAAGEGDQAAASTLYEQVYDELRVIARAQRRRWYGDDTLGTTALISEAYLRLGGAAGLNYANRTHFYATASRAMRQVLLNYAQRRRAAKRGGDQPLLDLESIEVADEGALEELIQINELLQNIEASAPRQARVFECRVFGGMTVEETAQALNISTATVKRDWRLASARVSQWMSPENK